MKLRRAGYDVNAAAQDDISPSAYAAEHIKVGDASLAMSRHIVTGAAKSAKFQNVLLFVNYVRVQNPYICSEVLL